MDVCGDDAGFYKRSIKVFACQQVLLTVINFGSILLLAEKTRQITR